jgi:hypothetical protein
MLKLPDQVEDIDGKFPKHTLTHSLPISQKLAAERGASSKLCRGFRRLLLNEREE